MAPTRQLHVFMPDKSYVQVANIGVKEAFDNKYKSSLSGRIKEELTDAVNGSSKLTTKQPAKKDAEGVYLDGALSLKRTDKGLEAELNLQLATWPKKAIFGMAKSKAAVPVSNEARLDRDVNDLVDAVLEDASKKALKEFEKRAP